MYDPLHPGHIIKTCFKAHKSMTDAFAKKGISLTAIRNILDGKAPVTPEIAYMLLSVIPGHSQDFWLRLQSNYDSWQSQHYKEFARKHDL